MRTQPPVPGQRAWVVFDVVSATAVTALIAAAWPLATLSLGSFGLISSLLLYSVAVTETPPVTLATLAVLYAADTASHRWTWSGCGWPGSCTTCWRTA